MGLISDEGMGRVFILLHFWKIKPTLYISDFSLNTGNGSHSNSETGKLFLETMKRMGNVDGTAVRVKNSTVDSSLDKQKMKDTPVLG